MYNSVNCNSNFNSLGLFTRNTLGCIDDFVVDIIAYIENKKRKGQEKKGSVKKNKEKGKTSSLF